ncbi:MAG: protoporphyrinogen oxidase [Haloarculaceae archaeon]
MTTNELPDSADVGVVGAGITGLALTRTLDGASDDGDTGNDTPEHTDEHTPEHTDDGDSSAPVVTLEASDEPGGIIRTRQVEGRVLDLGPQRTRRSPPVRALVEAMSLTEEVITASEDLPLYVFHDGALGRAPLSPRAAITTDLLSLRGKLRVLLEPLTGPPREGESVAGFLRRTLGPEAAECVAAPLYAGLYGSDPDDMPVEHSLAHALETAGIDRSILLDSLRTLLTMRLRGRERPPAVTFETGMAALPRALYRAHGDRIFLSTPVEGVGRTGERTEDSGGDRPGDRYRLDTPRGSVSVRDVVFTTPAPVTAGLLSEVAPRAADRLEGLSYNHLAVVHLDADFDRRGIGFLVAGEDTDLLGTTWNCSAFDREGVVTCYLGGAARPDLLAESDDTLGALAATEFESIVGGQARPLSVHRWTPGMPAYDGTWRALEGLDLPAGLHLCANFHARAGIPGRIRAARATAERLRPATT